jgi:hypothetical protein
LCDSYNNILRTLPTEKVFQQLDRKLTGNRGNGVGFDEKRQFDHGFLPRISQMVVDLEASNPRLSARSAGKSFPLFPPLTPVKFYTGLVAAKPPRYSWRSKSAGPLHLLGSKRRRKNWLELSNSRAYQTGNSALAAGPLSRNSTHASAQRHRSSEFSLPPHS